MKKRICRILSLVLVCLLVFSLCSCGKEENSNKYWQICNVNGTLTFLVRMQMIQALWTTLSVSNKVHYTVTI